MSRRLFSRLIFWGSGRSSCSRASWKALSRWKRCCCPTSITSKSSWPRSPNQRKRWVERQPTSRGHQARSGCSFRDLGIHLAIAARPSSAQNEETGTRSNWSGQAQLHETQHSTYRGRALWRRGRGCHRRDRVRTKMRCAKLPGPRHNAGLRPPARRTSGPYRRSERLHRASHLCHRGRGIPREARACFICPEISRGRLRQEPGAAPPSGARQPPIARISVDEASFIGRLMKTQAGGFIRARVSPRPTRLPP